MKLNKIKTVLDTNSFSDDIKKRLILSIIAEDKDAIPMILGILDAER